MSGPEAADSFIGKWLQRWPEWSIAEAFVPAPQRRTAVAWFALLQELADAAWGGTDPAPGLAKLAWWQEELEGWTAGARRQPLQHGPQRVPAPWAQLGRALATLPATRGQAPAVSLDALGALVAAISACEAALFEPQATPGDRDAAASAAAGFALLAERALLGAAREEAGWLLAHWPRVPRAALPGRLHGALLRARLEMLAGGKPVSRMAGWRVLTASWRASRGR